MGLTNAMANSATTTKRGRVSREYLRIESFEFGSFLYDRLDSQLRLGCTLLREPTNETSNKVDQSQRDDSKPRQTLARACV